MTHDTRPRSKRSLPILLAAASVLAGCGDDSIGPGTVDFGGLEQALEESQEAFFLRFDANLFIADALAELEQFGVVYTPVRSSLPLESLQTRHGVPSLPVLYPRVVFPPEVLGRTFVYDGGAASWAVDEERTGAPAGGIRVVWYETDGLGTPLDSEELGYFDLSDEDGGGLSRLGVLLVSTATGGPQVLTDYSAGYARTENGTAWSEELEADGYLIDGAGARVDFQVDGAGSGDDATDAEVQAYDLAYQTPDLSYSLSVDASVPADGLTREENLLIQVLRGSVSTRLELAVAGPTASAEGEGAVRHAGALVATITASGSQLTYSAPGGGSFTAGDRGRIDSAVGAMIVAGFNVLAFLPLLGLSAF